MLASKVGLTGGLLPACSPFRHNGVRGDETQAGRQAAVCAPQGGQEQGPQRLDQDLRLGRHPA